MTRCTSSQKAKLKQAISTTLTDRVKIDDAYNGGELTGSKVGQALPAKKSFVAAVNTDWQGKPQRLALYKVSGFTNEQIEAS